MDNNQNTNNQEIDLIYLGRKIKELFQNIGLLIFHFFQFLFRNKLIIISIIIIGVCLGIFLDKKSANNFKTEVVVVPNFESVDLLYSEVENINSNLKLLRSKNAFLEDIIKVEVNPIENLNTILQDKDNLEIVKVLTESGQDLSKIVKNEEFQKSYKYHIITIKTNSSKHSNQIVAYILKSINSKPYYTERTKLAIENQTNAKIQAEKSIEQINRILENLGNGNISVAGKDLNVNSYDQLANVIEMKNYYIKELAKINTRLIEFKSAVYPVDISYNNKINQKLYQQNKVIIPIALLLFFVVISGLHSFYRKYSVREN